MASTQLMNVGLTQTVYLQAVGTSTRIWLAGNGVSSFTVKSAVLTKGTASIVVKVNGHTSFQVPAMGRWSDYVSTVGFTLPGNATLSSVVFGEVPIIYIGSTGGWTGWAPAVATGVEYNVATNLVSNVSISMTNYPTGGLTSTQVANLNMSFAGAYAGEILASIIQHTGVTAYTLTENTLSATVTGPGLYAYPEDNVDGTTELIIKYYVSQVLAGTVTVCMEVFSISGPDVPPELDVESFAAILGSEYDTLETGCATVVGSKIYVTLTAAQLAKINLLLLGFKGQYYSASVPFTITIKDNNAFNAHSTPAILFDLSHQDISGAGWGWEFRFADTPTVGCITIGETAEQTALGLVDYINATGTVGVTATYSGNNIVSVVSGTDDINVDCAYSNREEYLAVFEFSESTRLVSPDPMAIFQGVYLLPFEAMQAVFDDPTVVDGEYTEPTLTETTEVVSTETITVSNNSQITEGDTLTNNVGGIPFVYTFRNLPTGAANEIIIGGTEAITAANIAAALNATDGAIFTATASSGVVSVTEYTSETVTKTTTSAGVTIGPVIQSVLYTTPDPVATLPAFTSNGLCSDGTGFLPKFTGAGTCTQDDFCIGRGVLPAMTCNAQSFISGLNYDSTKLEKISLLLNGNGFMQSFAPMVCVTDPDEAALLAVQFAANYITHTPDVIVWGTTESWVCPRGTLYYAQGDCEDGAFLIASLLLNIGVSSAKVKVAIGYYDDTGHAWAMYQRASDDIWVNLDWTKGSTYWNAISSVDELPVAFSEA